MFDICKTYIFIYKRRLQFKQFSKAVQFITFVVQFTVLTACTHVIYIVIVIKPFDIQMQFLA